MEQTLTLKDGEYTVIDSPPPHTLLREIWINPKLVIKRVKLRERGKYYIVDRLLIRDDKADVEKIPQMIFKLIEIKLKRVEKIERVKRVIIGNNGYVFQFTKKNVAGGVALYSIKIGGEKVTFPMTIEKDSAEISFDTFNVLFLKKVTKMFKGVGQIYPT